MSHQVKEFFEVSKKVEPKIVLFEYAYKLCNSSKDLKGMFNMFINKINLIDDYNRFVSYQKIIHSFIGKDDSLRRKSFEEKLSRSNNKTITSYHALLKLIKQKNKSSEQDNLKKIIRR